jgi:hypothetical protein
VAALALLVVLSGGAQAQVAYDFQGAAAIDHAAFRDRIPNGPIPPLSNSIPAVPFDGSDYALVAAADDSRFSIPTMSNPDRAAMRFVFTINEASPSLKELSVRWEGGAVSGGTVQVYLWDNKTATYTLLGSTSVVTPPDSIVTASFTNNAEQYVDAFNQVTILVVNTRNFQGVATDAVGVTIRTCYENVDCADHNGCTDDICQNGVCDYLDNTSPCSDGDACTVDDTCAGGVCESGHAPSCSTADPCRVASCDPLGEEGNCDALAHADDGTPCDDGLFCTLEDTCTAGACGGSPRACGEAGDQCNAAVCDEENKSCRRVPLPNTTACDDALFCTIADLCSNGTCVGRPRDCAASGDPCNEGVCSETSKTCESRAVVDGTACDDGTFCTIDDICQAGRCEGGKRDCDDLADQCNMGVCNEDAQACEAQPVFDGTSCDDERYCTVDDVCNGGACGGSPRDCTASDDHCNTGVCNEEKSKCELRPIAQGVACDDELFCTVDDVCREGVCGGSPRDCASMSDQCNVGVCDEATSACELRPVENGLPCADGLFCTVEDTCASGACRGVARDCKKQDDQCNSGVCNEDSDACERNPIEDGSACDDGLFCTVDDACVNGSCEGGNRDCRSFADQCTSGACNEDADSCETRPISDGIPCDDGLYCSVEDACKSGACLGRARNCAEAADQCNVGSCNEDDDSCDAEPVEDGSACDDGRFCTIATACANGQCVGAARDCSAFSDACNTGVCDEDAGACAARPRDDGTPCEDYLFCTIQDACMSGGCGGRPRDCGDYTDACNTGVCNEQTDTCEAQPTEDGALCDDGLYCTTGDKCAAGICRGTARNCSASGDQCNIGQCDEALGICKSSPVADGIACDDALYCTVEDSCLNGVCQGTTRSCDTAADQCNLGTCDEGNRTCERHPIRNGEDCDDGLFCTMNDVCVGGACLGLARDCNGGADQCNIGVCDETADRCTGQPLPDGITCDDGNGCIVGETCQLGHCCGGVPVDCSYADDQCRRTVCDPRGAEGNCDGIISAPNGTLCNDGLFCTSADECLHGTCTGKTHACSKQQCSEAEDACVECLDVSHCDDGIACTENACIEGACAYTARDPRCPDDGSFCNGVEYCDLTLGCVSTGDICPEDQLCDEARDACGECLVAADCEDGVACTADTCVEGGCVYTASNDRCADDGLFCNGLESCDPLDGCVSSGPACAADEHCNEETDTCDECRADADCDDGNPCTVDDTCIEGSCRPGEVVDCSTVSGKCLVASCDPAGSEGNCDVLAPVSDGLSCDDERFCTVKDACASGVCRGEPRDCVALGDQCHVAVCNEKAAICEALPLSDGSTCDDGLFCTVEDACAGGACLGKPRDCRGLDNECHVGSCDEERVSCVAQDRAQGTPCDDGLFCTLDDACENGVCTGVVRDCTESGDQCNTGACNEKENRCVAQPKADGNPCDDGNACRIGEVCNHGTCSSGAPVNCSAAADQCHVATCDETGVEGNCDTIELVADGTSCDDDLFCTVGDACNAGLCGGKPRECEEFNDQCNFGLCDENEAVCRRLPLPKDTACDDGAFCTVDDVCKAGTCAGTPRDCSEWDELCHIGVCNELKQTCESRALPDGVPCDDELACTAGDVCKTGACMGIARDCGELGDSCNVGFCDEESGACERRALEDGVPCDDGLFCTSEDACEAGACAGVARKCIEWSDQCSIGMCNEQRATCEAVPVEEGTACDDGRFCTVDDACREGVCSGTMRDCKGVGDQCNAGVCNEDADACGHRRLDDGLECDDGLYCTVDDACKDGVCVARERECEDPNDQCKKRVCDEDNDACAARAVDDGVLCDDELFCTVDDACREGVCSGAPRDCSEAGDECNDGVCHEETDSCEKEAIEDHTECDDGDRCTSRDHCQDGECRGQQVLGLTEWNQFVHCHKGVNTELDEECRCLDFDDDGDVDLNDGAEFQRRFQAE